MQMAGGISFLHFFFGQMDSGHDEVASQMAHFNVCGLLLGLFVFQGLGPFTFCFTGRPHAV